MKALVVDDSRIVRDRVIAMLREVDSIDAIHQAVDARSALEAVEHEQPDLVVLDIHMPSTDGVRIDNGTEVLRLIKARVNAPIVIMLSNYSEGPYRARSEQFGADAFLDKSHEFEQLADIAEALLKRRRGLTSA